MTEKEQAEIEMLKEKKSFYSNAGCLTFILALIALSYLFKHC